MSLGLSLLSHAVVPGGQGLAGAPACRGSQKLNAPSQLLLTPQRRHGDLLSRTGLSTIQVSSDIKCMVKKVHRAFRRRWIAAIYRNYLTFFLSISICEKVVLFVLSALYLSFFLCNSESQKQNICVIRAYCLKINVMLLPAVIAFVEYSTKS